MNRFSGGWTGQLCFFGSRAGKTVKMKYPKVVIIGGGFGGLNTALGLGKGPAEVKVLDKTNHHLFQPLLYQVATAQLSPADIARPIREVLSRQKNAVVLMGSVERIDRDERKVVMEDGSSHSYDALVVAVGVRHSYFGKPEWEAWAPGLKDVDDALTIRKRVLISFEMAERQDSLFEAERYLNFVVVGGGPTGVEMAGAIAEIAHKTLLRNFRRINPDKTRIVLVEAGPEILGSFDNKLSQKARKSLEELGVEVLTNTRVTAMDGSSVTMGNTTIQSCNVIWAAGCEAPPLLQSLQVKLDRQGRVIVESDCSIPGDPLVFVIGDAAHCKQADGSALPGLAPVAIQQGRYVARLIRDGVEKEKRKPFKYLDKGAMATIGRSRAILELGNIRMSGFLAWLGWCFVHIMSLITFRNKLRVMFEWCIHYVTGRRGSRLIYESKRREK